MRDATSDVMETDRHLEELARKRVEARNGFVIHVALYALVNAGLVVIWLVTGRGYPWFIWPLFGWGIGVLAHVLGWKLVTQFCGTCVVPNTDDTVDA